MATSDQRPPTSYKSCSVPPLCVTKQGRSLSLYLLKLGRSLSVCGSLLARRSLCVSMLGRSLSLCVSMLGRSLSFCGSSLGSSLCVTQLGRSLSVYQSLQGRSLCVSKPDWGGWFVGAVRKMSALKDPPGVEVLGKSLGILCSDVENVLNTGEKEAKGRCVELLSFINSLEQWAAPLYSRWCFGVEDFPLH